MYQSTLSHNPRTLSPCAGLRLLEPGLYCLKILDVRHCDFGPQGASHIASVLKAPGCKLEVLRLDGNKITGNSLLRGLLENESLRELHLAHTDIRDEGLLKSDVWAIPIKPLMSQ